MIDLSLTEHTDNIRHFNCLARQLVLSQIFENLTSDQQQEIFHLTTQTLYEDFAIPAHLAFSNAVELYLNKQNRMDEYHNRTRTLYTQLFKEYTKINTQIPEEAYCD